VGVFFLHTVYITNKSMLIDTEQHRVTNSIALK